MDPLAAAPSHQKRGAAAGLPDAQWGAQLGRPPGPGGDPQGSPRATMVAWLIAAGAVAAGCAQVAVVADPAVAQLDRYQQARAAGRWQAIADEPPVEACHAAAVAGCARVWALHGEAQQRLAFDSRAPGALCPPPTAVPRLAAAADALARSRSPADASVDAADQRTLRALRTQALYCLAENASSVDEGARRAREADAEAAALPPATALTWQALSRLYLARPGAGSDDQRCQAVRSAAEAASRARQAGADAEQQRLLERVLHDAAQRRASIAGCGG